MKKEKITVDEVLATIEDVKKRELDDDLKAYVIDHLVLLLRELEGEEAHKG